jgi:hypothetical protein
MKMTFCRQGQEVHKGKDIEQTPQSKVSKTIIKLTTFFHSLVILYHISGADPGFQVRGAHLTKLRRAEGGAKFVGVFRVKNHDFTQKNHIFSNFRGGARRVRAPPPPLDPPRHLNSRVPQELKAIFFDNYLVPTLVSNVNPK